MCACLLVVVVTHPVALATALEMQRLCVRPARCCQHFAPILNAIKVVCLFHYELNLCTDSKSYQQLIYRRPLYTVLRSAPYKYVQLNSHVFRPHMNSVDYSYSWLPAILFCC